LSTLRKIIALIIVTLLFTFGANMNVFADDSMISQEMSVNELYDSHVLPAANSMIIDRDYKTVYSVSSSSPSGIDRGLYIRLYVADANMHADVRMYGKYNNLLWEEYGAVDYGSSRTFICGADVYRVQIRLAAKNITGDLFGPKSSIIDWELRSSS